VAVLRAKAVAEVKHAGLRGEFREIFVHDLLQPVLPSLRIGSGVIVSHTGDQSPQVDAIIYSDALLPAFLQKGGRGLFPVEACLYSIEVKSKLTTPQLRSSIKSARMVRDLPVLPARHFLTGGNEKILSGVPPIRALFAFESDQKGDPRRELDRYLSLDPDAASKDPALAVICILGRGYWWVDRENSWHFTPPTVGYRELMVFLAGIANTCPEIMHYKGSAPFGWYLVADDTLGDVVRTGGGI
jgi:hypothetical protein